MKRVCSECLRLPTPERDPDCERCADLPQGPTKARYDLAPKRSRNPRRLQRAMIPPGPPTRDPKGALTTDQHRAESESARVDRQTKRPPWGDCTAAFNCPCPTCRKHRARFEAEARALSASRNPSR